MAILSIALLFIFVVACSLYIENKELHEDNRLLQLKYNELLKKSGYDVTKPLSLESLRLKGF